MCEVVVQKDNLNDLIQEIDRLDTVSKAHLTKKLLADSGINVSFGGNMLTGPVIIQINSMDKEAIADILEQVGSHLKRDNLANF